MPGRSGGFGDEKDPPGPALGRRGLPETSSRSPRVTLSLSAEEAEALAAFADEHHWSLSTAARVILRAKLLGERIP